MPTSSLEVLLEIEVGTQLRRLPRRNAYGEQVGGDTWVATAQSLYGEWVMQLVDPGPTYPREIGYELHFSTSWITDNMEVISRPSTAAPMGDGKQFARVTHADGTTNTNRHDGTAFDLVEWIRDMLTVADGDALIEWWGFDAPIFGDDGEIVSIDDSPDLTATFDGINLIWAEA